MTVRFRVDVAAVVALSVSALTIGSFLFGMFAANRKAAAEAAEFRHAVQNELIALEVVCGDGKPDTAATFDAARFDLGLYVRNY